jgi:PAS domain-containing protein
VDPELRAFPTRDGDFVAFARAALAALPAPKTATRLQQALRVRYPAAVVTVQEELARHGEGPIVWYAFRTAAAGTPSAEPDAFAEPAWAILDDDRRFLDVSPALARIAELPARRMVGRPIEEFSNPADPTIREDIERLWEEFRAGGSLASTVRFNYRDGRPRELAYRVLADADGPGRHRLTVVVLSGSADRAGSPGRERGPNG